MKIRALLLLALVCLPFMASAGEPVDRVVATVNDDPVLASEIEDAVRMEAFMQGRAMKEISPADFDAARERLIDRTLIRQQMMGAYTPLPEQVNRRMAQIQAAFPAAKSEAEWRSVLAAYGIEERQLRQYVEEQLQLMQYVDTRMQPLVRVSRGEVERYYREKLLPELSRQGVAPEPLANVQAKIYEILSQQKIDSELSDWLANLRNQAGVQILPPARAEGNAGASKAMSFSAIVE